MEIVTRAEWGAAPPKDPPTKTKVLELYLHHSVGSGMVDKDGDGDKGDDYMKSMQTFHMAPPRNWDDIAYNHAYDPDGGEVYEGRGWGIRPGAQCGHNTGTHSLVVMGNYAAKPVTEKMKQDIAAFYRDAWAQGLLPKVTIQGHRDAPLTGTCSGTTCPGNSLYAALPAINAIAQEDEMTPFLAPCKLGDTGVHVSGLQTILFACGFYKGSIHGKYDAATSAAVLAMRKFRKSTATSGDEFSNYAMEQLLSSLAVIQVERAGIVGKQGPPGPKPKSAVFTY